MNRKINQQMLFEMFLLNEIFKQLKGIKCYPLLATLESHQGSDHLAFASCKRSLGRVRKILLGKCSSKKARKGWENDKHHHLNNRTSSTKDLFQGSILSMLAVFVVCKCILGW